MLSCEFLPPLHTAIVLVGRDTSPLTSAMNTRSHRLWNSSTRWQLFTKRKSAFLGTTSDLLIYWARNTEGEPRSLLGSTFFFFFMKKGDAIEHQAWKAFLLRKEKYDTRCVGDITMVKMMFSLQIFTFCFRVCLFVCLFLGGETGLNASPRPALNSWHSPG